MSKQKYMIIRAALIVIALSSLIVAAICFMFSPAYFSPNDVKLINPHYLVGSSGNESRIFLVSATPSYGTYPFQDAHGLPGKPDIHTGDPCFIINVTIRNDYTPQNPLPYYQGSVKEVAFIFLTAKLYDSNGTIIETTNVTPPYPSPSQFGAPLTSVPYGEEFSFKMYLAPANQNVDHFSIEMLYLGSIPPP